MLVKDCSMTTDKQDSRSQSDRESRLYGGCRVFWLAMIFNSLMLLATNLKMSNEFWFDPGFYSTVCLLFSSMSGYYGSIRQYDQREAYT